MVLGILKEGKTPPDERVPLAPTQVKKIKDNHPLLNIQVQKSPIRCFKDNAYEMAGAELVDGLESADVLIGVKEVPVNMLIPEKTYMFFSHTIKKQPYNRGLLRAILDKNIKLVDWECLTDRQGRRLIGFGRYAGIVGAYNGFRALGLRNKQYDLKPAHACTGRNEVELELRKVKLPSMKILLTGRGRVAKGAMEILDLVQIRKVSVDEYLHENFEEPVYCQITFMNYFRKKDKSKFASADFFAHPEGFESNFMRFAKVTDMLVTGHFWSQDAPFIFTREDTKCPDFKIKVVADISCDIDGPIACTLRPSTIEDPVYGYDPVSESETAFDNPDGITVMAVDNLPCELPKDASIDFGNEFIKNVLPAFFNGDKDTVLKRGTIAENGKLTPAFSYLQDYVNGADI